MATYERGDRTASRNSERASRQATARRQDQARGRSNPVTVRDVADRAKTGQTSGRIVSRFLGR
jgi:hypothetical protein